MGEHIAQVAAAQVGKAYEYGQAGPDSFDTSGLIRYCYSQAGLNVPRRVSEQAAFGVEVSQDDLQPGDILVFWSDDPNEAGFSAIYIGNDQFAYSSSSKNAVSQGSVSNSYYQEHFFTARRAA